MPGRSLTSEEILTLLVETPPRIAEHTTGLTPVQLRTAPQPDEWSAVDVLAHLRACADMWGACIVTILAKDHPMIRAVNPKSWIKQTNYRDLEFELSWHAFMTQRADLLAVLEPLPSESWSRSATVTGAGAVLERTVHDYARRLARHERSHFKQFQHIADALRV